MSEHIFEASEIALQFTPSEGIYLLAHSIGKMPKTTAEYCQQHFFAAWQSGQSDIWPHWLAELSKFDQALARLLNASADEFCPQSNVSSGLTKLIAALPARAGKDTILMTANDFPSAGFVLQQATRLGYKIKLIDKHADPLDIDVWRQAMTPDIHSVFITHVHYNTNRQVPVNDITRLATECGAFSIVDIAQSAGIVPIDLQQWQADAVVGSCIKWLCGGPGAGFLWVNKSIINTLKPLDLGWFSHADPFEFDIQHFQYASDSKRFWGGTPSVLPYITATHSIELICEIGVDRIRAHNIRLSNMVLDQCSPQEIVCPVDPAQRGGTLVLKPHKQAEIVKKLTAAKVLFDQREYGIRLSSHIYTSDTEIAELCQCFN